MSENKKVMIELITEKSKEEIEEVIITSSLAEEIAGFTITDEDDVNPYLLSKEELVRTEQYYRNR